MQIDESCFRRLAPCLPDFRGTSLLAVILLLALSQFVFLSAQAQSNYVYVHNQGVASTIAAYSVSPVGALTPLAGSPYLTGGVGSSITCYGLDQITLNAASNLLFVSNAGDQSISVFKINPASGVLVPAAGSPFASGLSLGGCQGISLAATPDGKFLMASSNGQIQTFSIALSGALAPLTVMANRSASTAGMKISANGRFLALSNETSVSIYTINVDGSLTAVAGSPFAATGSGILSGLDFRSCSSNLLYGGEATNGAAIADAWSVAANGALTPVAGSPFSSGGANSNVVLLSSDNSTLFESNQFNNSINTFTVQSDGSLVNVGGFGGVGSLHLPVGMATNRAGSLLYIADDNFGLAVFRIDGAGALSPLTDLVFAAPGEIQGLAAYPDRVCAHADLALAISAAPSPVNAGSNITYTITISNAGPDASAATISDILPASTTFVSCSATGGGLCGTPANNADPANRTVSFASLASGETETATVVVQSSSLLLNNSSIANTAAISNNSAIDLNPANNSVSASVTISAPLASTSLLVPPVTLGFYGGNTSLTATLQRASNSPGIAGRTIAFTLNGIPVGSASTDVNGVANLTTSIGNLGIGLYPNAISASFAGDIAYAASSGSSLLEVKPGILTVVPGNASRLYGSANPPFTYTITGGGSGANAAIISGSPVCTTTATTASNVGIYSITCAKGTLSVAGVNYSFISLAGGFSSTLGTLTVNPAPLTVTADNASRLYGDPNPLFTSSYVGLVNGDSPAVVSGAASCSSPATPASPVGTYPITCSQGTLSAMNYTFASFVDGTLTVNPAPLTATGNNATRQYGNANPAFSGIISGLKNGDVITATWSSTATPASNVGTYPITPTLVDLAGKLGNYTVTIIPGTLTITPAPLTVTVNNATRIYGNPNPAFTLTFVGLKNADPITATFSTVGQTASVGSYPITAVLVDPAGKLPNYIVTINNGTLTITKASLSVTGFNGQRLYGDPNPAPSISGLKNSDPITGTYTAASPTAASPIGTYIMVPALSDPTGKLVNYTVTLKNGTMTINKAPLVVAGANATRPYGSANPAFTGTITGIKNADPITATFSSTATVNSNAGTVAITSTLSDPTAKLGNYTLTTSNGVLTITPVALKITANNATMILNATTPAFTATYSGFVLGQGQPNLTGTLSCSANGSTIGTHSISCSGQSSTNYSITSVAGTLSVTYAPVGTCNNGPGHQILAPINVNGNSIFVKATNASIPVQFRVCDAKGVAVSSTVVSSFALVKIGATTVNQTPVASDSKPFTFNGTAQDWLFNLGTANLNSVAGTVYQYQIGLNDGTSISFQFTLQ